MTIRSMTGFARVRATLDCGELQLEIKSINHRYLEVFLRQPEELRGTDIVVRQRLNERLGRGKVDVAMRLLDTGSASRPLVVNTSTLEQLAAVTTELRTHLPMVGTIDPLALLRWPGMLQDAPTDDERVQSQVLAALDDAIEQLQDSRADEGRRLQAMLEERLQQITSVVGQVQQRLPEQNRKWREKLRERLAEVAEMDPERRDQALVQFAQRADVDEELDRLGSHVTEVRTALAKGSPVGRKLDFYMQEFNREANTLGSKAMDAEITRLAVELKVLIEQMREQVQNIE